MTLTPYDHGRLLCLNLCSKLGRQDGTEAAPRNFFRSADYHVIVAPYKGTPDLERFNSGYKDEFARLETNNAE